MLNRVLEYNYSAILIFFFVLVLKVVLYYSGQVYSNEYDASIIRLFDSATLWSGIYAAIMSVIIGLLILVISESFAKRTDFSLWVVLIFVLQMNYYSFFSFSAEYVGLFFFVVSLYFFFKGTRVLDIKRTTVDCFNLSFSLALGCYFTPHLVYLLPLFWFGRIFVAQAQLKSFLASLLGFIIPFLLVDATIYVFYNDVAEYSVVFLLQQLQMHESVFVSMSLSWPLLASIGVFMSLLLISLFFTFTHVLSSKSIIRNYNQMNAIILLYVALMVIIGFIPSHFGMMLFFVPSAYFFSNFQCLMPRRWRNSFLAVFVLSVCFSYPVIIDNIVAFFNVFFDGV